VALVQIAETGLVQKIEANTLTAPALDNRRRRSWRTAILPPAATIAAMLVCAGLGLASLDNQPFWDDEANTAIYARNLLHLKRITAWDSINLLGYGLSGALGDDLGRELRVPSLPAYVVAAGMLLGGENTTAARLPLVLAGVISVGLLALWLRRHLGRRFPYYLPALLLALSPAFLLYIRNCRYYALGVMFSLAVWLFWAPGTTRGGRGKRGQARHYAPSQSPLAWGLSDVLRYAGAVTALVLLFWTHYLNAFALVATLPLFFLDRRYRQRRQYVLFGLLAATAGLYCLWIWIMANPFAAQYVGGQDWRYSPPLQPDLWTRFYINLGWFLRDLGTHEFLPWVLVAVPALALIVPWSLRWLGSLPITRSSGSALRELWRSPSRPRRSRFGLRSLGRWQPLAWRGLILVAVILTQVVIASALLPSDMGKGPTAEMRYVVPLLALGAAVGGIALLLLWRALPPLAPLAGLLLVTTNWLYLGFLIDRLDDTDAWWPPTIYRYVYELCNHYESGNEAMLRLLRELPDGTTVRIWPTFMTYPPMFYQPRLHYCDQLTESKQLREGLRERLPDYVFVERAQPDVVIVPAPFLLVALEDLGRPGAKRYRFCKSLRPHFNYTSKPEIPTHWFWPPEENWFRYPGMVVLVAADSGLDKLPALGSGAFDAASGCQAYCEAGVRLAEARCYPQAIEQYNEALRLNPRDVQAHLNLAAACEALGKYDEAVRQYRVVLEINPTSAPAHYNLGNRLLARKELEEAETHYRAALASQPDYPQARINLAGVLLKRGKTAEAKQHFAAALRGLPANSPDAAPVKRILEQLK
jgi:tetratricopeptide (TPR) repeat protein